MSFLSDAIIGIYKGTELRNYLYLIYLNKIFPMKPSEFKIFLSVGSYDEKNAE